MTAAQLDAEMMAAAKASSFIHAQALIRLGVSVDTIAGLRRHHWGWGIARVSDAGDGLYLPGEGSLHVVLPVYEDGDLIDLCAFRSRDPNGWLLRTGLGWALGVERGLERHTWGDPVFLALSPLQWLRQRTSGLCVLDWDAPEVRYLVGVPNLVCSTPDHAATLRRALSTPVRFPQISVMEPLAYAA